MKFCDTKTKDQFTSKACNKLVKDCFEEHYKFKQVILTNRVDSSVFSKCKEKGKPYVRLFFFLLHYFDRDLGLENFNLMAISSPIESCG